MAARSLATRWLVVGLVIVAFALALAVVAGCGTSDKWVGTWVNDNNGQKTALEIEKKNDTTYTVHDPDGKNAFDATLSGNTLTGTLTITSAGGQSVKGDVTITLNGDTMKFSIASDSLKQPITMDLTKQ